MDKYTFIYFRISVIFDNLLVTISMWFCIVKFSSIIIPRKTKIYICNLVIVIVSIVIFVKDLFSTFVEDHVFSFFYI